MAMVKYAVPPHEIRAEPVRAPDALSISGATAHWIDIRSPSASRLLCRYDPVERRLEFKVGDGRYEIVALADYDRRAVALR